MSLRAPWLSLTNNNHRLGSKSGRWVTKRNVPQVSDLAGQEVLVAAHFYFGYPQWQEQAFKMHYRANIVNLDFGQYLKPIGTVNEVRVLDYLRKHTNIPVPRVYSAWKASNRPNALCCVIMSKIPGETLQEAWPDMDKYQRDCVARRFRTLVETLMSKEQHCIFVTPSFCSFDGGPIKDPGLNPVWVGARLKQFSDATPRL